MTSYWAIIVDAGIDSVNYFKQKIKYRGKTANSVPIYPYGYHANADNDSQALVISVNGESSVRAIFPWNPKSRPVLKQREITLYQPVASGEVITTVIKFDENGNILIDTAADITANCNNATITATTKVTVTAPEIVNTATTSIVVTSPIITLAGDVTTDKFGTNGQGAKGSATLGAVATSPAQTQALANAIRTALIANGIGVT